MGKLVGDHLQCHYHGLRFDSTGRCVRIPGQDRIPAAAKVKTYPVVERYRWIWIWMGDPGQADPDQITDFHWLQDENWGAKSSYLHVKANWQLVVDNLLDLTHLAFVHESTIGNAALAEHAVVKVTAAPSNVVVTRWIVDQPAPADLRQSRRLREQRRSLADHRLRAPAFLRLDVGATPTGTGAPEGTRVNGSACATSMPSRRKTETTSHYFWGQAHDFDVKNQETTNKIFEQIQSAFFEDVEVFSAQQRNLDLMPNAPQLDINADSGVIQARRILDRLTARSKPRCG